MRKITLFLTTLLLVTKAMATVDIANTYYTTVTTETSGKFALYDVTGKTFVAEGGWTAAGTSDTPYYWTVAYNSEKKAYTLARTDGKYLKIGYYDGQYVYTDGESGAITYWTFTTNGTKTYTVYSKNGDHADSDGGTNLMADYYLIGANAGTESSSAHEYALISKADYANYRTANPLHPYKFRETSAITSGTYALYDIEAGKFLACNPDPFYQYFEYSNVPVYCTIAQDGENYTIKYVDKFMTQYPTRNENIYSDARIKWLTSDQIASSEEYVTDKNNDYKWAFISTNDEFENSYMLADITTENPATRLYYGVNPGTEQRLTVIGSGGVHHVVFVKQDVYDAAAKAEDVTMTSARYATFFNATDETYLLPLAYKAFALKLNNEGNIVEEEISCIPAQTAVMLTYNNGNIHNWDDTGDHTYPLYKSMESAAAIEGNLLQGTATATEITHDGNGTHYYYTLQNGSNGVGLYYADATSDTPGTGKASFTNAAKKAYLVLTKNAGGAQIKSYIFGEGAEYEDFGATAIESVGAAKVADDAIYNLAGQKVGADYKGIVIKNGKKYIVK